MQIEMASLKDSLHYVRLSELRIAPPSLPNKKQKPSSSSSYSPSSSYSSSAKKTWSQEPGHKSLWESVWGGRQRVPDIAMERYGNGASLSSPSLLGASFMSRLKRGARKIKENVRQKASRAHKKVAKNNEGREEEEEEEEEMDGEQQNREEEKLLATGGFRFPSYWSTKTGRNVDFVDPSQGLEFRRLLASQVPHNDDDQVLAFHVRVPPIAAAALGMQDSSSSSSSSSSSRLLPAFFIGQQMILHSTRMKGVKMPVTVDNFEEAITGPHGLIWLRCSV
jgi:hypothetical protein